MSVAASAWAWRHPLDCYAKIVLLALADHADDRGICWPGLWGLAEKCNMDRRTVQRKVRELEALQLIRTEPNNGRKGTSLYRLNLSLVTDGHSLALEEGGGRLPPLRSNDGAAQRRPGRQPQHTGGGSLPPESSEENRHKKEKTPSDGPPVGGTPAPTGQHGDSRAAGVGRVHQTEAEGILRVLNQEARRAFPARRPNGDPTQNLLAVVVLLDAGWTVEQLERVTRLKCRQWRDSPKDVIFLRPSTLYRPRNFEGYVGELADAGQARRAEQARTQPRTNHGLQPVGESITRGERERMMAEAGLKVQTSAPPPVCCLDKPKVVNSS